MPKEKDIEIDILTQLVMKYEVEKDLNPMRRNAAWKSVTDEYMQATGRFIDHQQIKKKWQNHKFTSKSKKHKLDSNDENALSNSQLSLGQQNIYSDPLRLHQSHEEITSEGDFSSLGVSNGFHNNTEIDSETELHNEKLKILKIQAHEAEEKLKIQKIIGYYQIKEAIAKAKNAGYVPTSSDPSYNPFNLSEDRSNSSKIQSDLVSETNSNNIVTVKLEEPGVDI